MEAVKFHSVSFILSVLNMFYACICHHQNQPIKKDTEIEVEKQLAT